LQIDIEESMPLLELKACINRICNQAEAQGDAVVVLRFTVIDNKIEREWPGRVAISDVNRWERTVEIFAGFFIGYFQLCVPCCVALGN
jgi:hypothetical protein